MLMQDAMMQVCLRRDEIVYLNQFICDQDGIIITFEIKLSVKIFNFKMSLFFRYDYF